MKDIKEWLERGGDYRDGLSLFILHSRSKPKKSYLQRKEDMPKLRYELSKIVGEDREPPRLLIIEAATSSDRRGPVASNLPMTPSDPSRSPIKPDEQLRMIGRGQIIYATMPDPVKNIYALACEEYRLMRSLHEKMKLVCSDTDRAALRLELDTLDTSHHQKWALIDAWHTTGVVPSCDTLNASAAAADEQPTPKELNAARTSLSRNLALLSKATDPPRVEELTAKISQAVAVVTAAGCGFGKNAETLIGLGLIDAPIE